MKILLSAASIFAMKVSLPNGFPVLSCFLSFSLRSSSYDPLRNAFQLGSMVRILLASTMPSGMFRMCERALLHW